MIKEMAAEVSLREGCELYDVEFSGVNKGRILRIFIDGEDVGVDHCAKVSNGVSLRLDVEDVIPGGGYELEVSTPGLERHLKDQWHFEKAVGSKVKVKTKDVIFPLGQEPNKKQKIKQAVGELKEVKENKILILDEKNEWEIDLDNVHKANIIFEFSKNHTKSSKNKKR